MTAATSSEVERERSAWRRPSAELEAEAIRLNLRFNVEIVEGFHVCPFARAARLAKRSVARVAWLETLDPDAFVAVVADVEKDDTIEVAQVVMPLVRDSAEEFLERSSEVARKNAARCGGRPVFVHAAFHPELPYATDTPQRLVPFFRRSPDPMIQLVRLSVLDEVHANRPRGTQFWSGSLESLAAFLKETQESVTDRIARENHERAAGEGLAQMKAILDDIRRDRDETYARIGTAR